MYYRGKPTKKDHREYTIEVIEVDRDWSEDAYEYSVPELDIVGECEGEDEAFEYAIEEIDKSLK